MADGSTSEYVVEDNVHFLPQLGDKLDQPKSFAFPKQKFGNQKPTY